MFFVCPGQSSSQALQKQANCSPSACREDNQESWRGHCRWSFIIDAPDETREEMWNTTNFAKRVPIDLPQFNTLGAHPGNAFWNEFVAKGFLDPEKWWEKDVAVSEVYTYVKVSREEIMRIMHDAFFLHVYRPSFLVKQVAKTFRSPYRMNVLVSNLS